MADQFENQWETLNDGEKTQTLGKLKALEELQNYIDLIREGYTRLLKINGVKEDGTWEDKEPENLVKFDTTKYKIIDNDSDDASISPSPNHASP